MDSLKPVELPAGTVIEIGPRPDKPEYTINPEAIGLVFTLKEATYSDAPAESGQILENPNGWTSERVIHKINLKYDKIVESSNKYFKGALDSI